MAVSVIGKLTTQRDYNQSKGRGLLICSLHAAFMLVIPSKCPSNSKALVAEIFGDPFNLLLMAVTVTIRSW